MEELVHCPAFPMVANFIWPGKDVEEVRKMFLSFHNVLDFQREIMASVVQIITEKTCDGFSFSGLERLDPSKQYLYVANHRDIVLDAMLQQFVLVRNGFDTAEITFGANLMTNKFVADAGRLNKMFKVERPGTVASARDFYEASRHLSDYIRYAIKEKKQSVWIAQRNGRTKDGLDITDPAIIKMLLMGGPEDKIDSISELSIVPMSVSYEWEPCDILKVLEMYESSRMTYIKKPGEDLNSIITGIMQQKGRVHLAFCRPLELSELESLRSLTVNQFCREVASLIDSEIRSNYRLYPNNYIAADLRFGSRRYSSKYTAEQKKAFQERLAKLSSYCYSENAPDLEELTDKFLALYANSTL